MRSWEGVPSTSYETQGMSEALYSLVFGCDPVISVELGAQKGRSAVIIASAMRRESRLYVYDTFEDRYSLPPFGLTHARQSAVEAELAAARTKGFVGCSTFVRREDAAKAFQNHVGIDFLHIDICNHYDNLKPILLEWHKKVRKVILLCGGDSDAWLDGETFRAFSPMLSEEPISELWDASSIQFCPGREITLLRRK